SHVELRERWAEALQHRGHRQRHLRSWGRETERRIFPAAVHGVRRGSGRYSVLIVGVSNGLLLPEWGQASFHERRAEGSFLLAATYPSGVRKLAGVLFLLGIVGVGCAVGSRADEGGSGGTIGESSPSVPMPNGTGFDDPPGGGDKGTGGKDGGG